jgi:protoporphyrinogen oxidase
MSHHSLPPGLVVIGGGPAGLTAAFESARNGIRPLVLEAGERVGGIARTEVHKGYRFDIGGHRFYTKVPEVQSLWEETLGPEFRLTPRLSRIFYNQRFYQYPLDVWETLRNLGPVQSTAAIASFTGARLRPNSREESFEDWVTNRFGRQLFNTFFKTYTEKVWGIPCHEIRAEWAAQRIKDLSFGSAVRQALFPKRDSGPKSLINEFHYPRLGPGMMWERLQDRIALLGGSVRTREEVTEVHHDGRQVTHVVTRSGNHRTSDIHAPQFISTMALDDLIARLRPAPPAEVLHAAASLRYRDFVLVGLVVRRTGLFADNWLYIHSPNVRVGRIQNFGNWSADLVPEPGTSSIGMEYFCNRGDSTWNLPDEDFVRLASREMEQLGLARSADVAWGVVIRQPKAYPVYDTTYRRHLDVLRAWLPKLSNFQTIGRNGQHRYNNQDHSMLTGLAAVHRIMGEPTDPWEVNTERSYYEEQRVNRNTPLNTSP